VVSSSSSNSCYLTETAVLAEQRAQAAPEKAASKKAVSQKKGAPKGKTAAKRANTKAAAPKKEAKATKKAAEPGLPKKTVAPRAENKGAKIIEMIGRAKGATLAEIMQATDWQAHNVRGFISGTIGKKMALTVESTKRDNERVYSISK
jgi:DNA replication initiation complex subunit (GINS family)